MRRIWICVGILAVIFCASLCNSFYLTHLTNSLTGSLDRAQVRAEAGDWAGADRDTGEALDRWDRSTGYLYLILRHSDVDQVASAFQEVEELLEGQDESEYTPANARLKKQIQQLAEMEQCTLRNLL